MEKQHLIKQFDTELNEIRANLLEMGGKVELMIYDALKALVERDSPLAERVIALDHEINRLEMEIDEKCLERIADHATNVAEMVIFMVKGKDIRHTVV